MAFFGQKDFQQCLVIKKLVADFNLPIHLHFCPIIREKDGLALSSRNIHLNEEERTNALILSETLNFVKENYNCRDIDSLLLDAKDMISNRKGVELAYLEIRDRDSLSPPTSEHCENAVVLVAAQVGNTRLIDNMMLE